MTNPPHAADVWRPRASTDTARRRAESLQAARTFFARHNVLEVDTPILATHTVTEPNIDSLQTHLGNGQSLFLQTSPEYFMKRMLAAGYPDIFQICTVFRDGETGRRHLPEFTMVEWYRLGFSLQEIMQETVAFASSILGRKELRETTDYVSYADAFVNRLNMDPLTCTIDSLANATQAGATLRRALGDERDAWLDLVMAECVSPAFATDRLTVVHHYPASQAALARRCPANDALADRFELYYGELELANGFVELVDANEQLSRFENDRQKRRNRGLAVHSVDTRFVAALQHGLPPCAGVAIGFDRLMMILEGQQELSAVHAFTGAQ
jgi:lysyl-tRNA synthetase class 2